MPLPRSTRLRIRQHNIVSFLDSAAAQRFRAREWRQWGVAVAVDVDQNFRRQFKPSGGCVYDRILAWWGIKVRSFLPVPGGKYFLSDFRHNPDRKFKNFPAVHLNVVKFVFNSLPAGRKPGPPAGSFSNGPPDPSARSLKFVNRSLPGQGQNNRSGCIPEENTGTTILPVHKFGQVISAHHQNITA